MYEKPIAIAADHAGYELKEKLKTHLEAQGYKLNDLGAYNTKSVDYTDYAQNVARGIKSGKADRGIIVCGSGIGVSIAANRFTTIRAALVQDVTGARLARSHNDANVLCLGSRLIGENVAKDCVDAFLTTAFDGGRHQQRIDKMDYFGECDE